MPARLLLRRISAYERPARNATTHETVEAPQAGDAVGEHDAEREHKKDWIRAHGSGHEIIDTHEETEECHDAGEEPEHEPGSHQEFADCYQVRPGDEVGKDSALEECGVPRLDVWMGTDCLCQRALDKTLEGRAGACAEPCRTDHFFPSSHEPLPAQVEADDEPERSASGVCREEINKRGLSNSAVVHSFYPRTVIGKEKHLLVENGGNRPVLERAGGFQSDTRSAVRGIV